MSVRASRKVTIPGFAVFAFTLVACSKSAGPVPNAGTAPPVPPAAASAQIDSCKDFPLAIYPRTSSAICEVTPKREGNPLHHTAYLKSSDAVTDVATYYQTQIQSTGWMPKPTEVQTADHVVVTLEKGKAYASVVVNAVAGGAGSSIQINAYPTGND